MNSIVLSSDYWRVVDFWPCAGPVELQCREYTISHMVDVIFIHIHNNTIRSYKNVSQIVIHQVSNSLHNTMLYSILS